MSSDSSIVTVGRRTNPDTEWGALFSGGTENLDRKAIMAAFLSWIEQQSCADCVEVLLFTNSTGLALHKEYLCRAPGVRSSHLPDTAIEFTLAELNDATFLEHLPVLITECVRSPISEFLEERGVSVPSLALLSNVGLSSRTLSSKKESDVLKQFLCAYRYEIFKVGRKKRKELFHRFLHVGIRDCTRVGVVDLGWNGSIRPILSRILNDMFEQISIYGYSFLLRDDSEGLASRAAMPVHAMLSGDTCSDSVIEMVYNNRAVIERLLAECPTQDITKTKA